MSDFEWTDELTEFALGNMKHATWAASTRVAMLRVINRFQEKGDEITKEERETLLDELGVKWNDVFDFLTHLRLITKDPFELTTPPEPEEPEPEEPEPEEPEPGDRPGFYTGQELGEVIRDLGLGCPEAGHILGHNYMLHERGGLSFCGQLRRPGLPKNFLKDQLQDHYVFNQKLNEFKFDNLIGILEDFGVIKEGNYGLIIEHAPPVLTFYQMASSYFYLSGWKVNHKIDAKGLLQEVDSVIPQRDEDYSALGFNQFPIEGWGKHQAWMSLESFLRMLEIGLIEPKTIAHILLGIARDKVNSSRDLAKNAATRIKHAILEDIKIFKPPKPIGYEEVVSLLEQVENS